MAASAKLVGYPEEVANRERVAEIRVGLRTFFGRGRDSEAAADQAKQLATEVGHYRATITGVERGLNLNQPAELM